MRHILLSSAMAFVLTATAQAGIVNGDFETGNTSGWQIFPPDFAEVQDIDGSQKLVITIGNHTPTDFAAGANQTFNVDGLSPKELSFEFSGQFVSTGTFPDDGGIVYNVQIHRPMGNPTIEILDGVAALGESLSIPTTTFTAILEPGTYTLDFSMVRYNQPVPSFGTMIIDNVQLVPEPSAVALFLLGTATILVCRARTLRGLMAGRRG